MRLRSLSALAGAAIAVAGHAAAAAYTLTPENTRVAFEAEIAGMVGIEGHFTAFSGHAALDPDLPDDAALAVEIVTASASCATDDLTATVRGPDFFDAARNPAIRFASRSIRRIGAGRLAIDGDLTLRGTTRPVSLEAGYGERTGPDGRRFIVVEARTQIDRRAFGLDAYGPILDDTVEIAIGATLLADAAAAP
jgi:polyisoprenoid-binding protein YceI